MDQRNLNGKGLMVSISEESRSLSPSPQPGSLPMMHGGSQGSMPSELGMLADDSPYLQEDSSGEGEQSHFGRAKKSKRKAAPRTSRACLACRRQKMRCEGAENPPCRRCISNEVDCMFERRSDYLLNPEDRAWQNGVEKRLEHLSRTIDMILAHLGGGNQPPPATAVGGFPPEMHQNYHEVYERQGIPNTASAGPGDMSATGGRINYVVPSPAETAAIAAQARMKRGRGNTMPNMPSASYPPDAGFQLFSPSTAALDAGGSLPNPYSYGVPTPGPHSAHGHQQMHQHQHQRMHEHPQAHSLPHPHQQQQAQPQASSHQSELGPEGAYSHTYSFDPYSGQNGFDGSTGSIAGQEAEHEAGQHQSSSGHPDLVPRSLGSPGVRYDHGVVRNDIHSSLGAPPLHGQESVV